MPQLALVLLNVTGIVVGLVVMADPAPTWLSVAWATMIVLILGRIIVESVTGGEPGEPRDVVDGEVVATRPAEPAEPADPDDVLDPDPPEFVDPTLDDDSGVIGAGRPRRSDPPPDAQDDPAPEALPASVTSDDTGPTRDPGPARVLFEVRTAYSSRLNGLALAWPADADQLFLGGPRLRLWVAAAGRPVDGGYALGLAARAGDHDPRTWPAVDAALRRTGLDGVLSDHGLDVVISGRKRLARLAELVGQRPDAAPAEFWPGGATA
jgi:hypothetical protein